MSNTDRTLLSTAGASAYLGGLSPATLTTMRSRGGGPPYAVLGRVVRYRIADLDAWVDARTRSSTADVPAAERRRKPTKRKATKARTR